MQFLLDVKDSKAAFIVELLQNFSFVKTKPLTPSKAQLLEEIKGSVDEVILAREGKVKLQSARSFLDEL